MIRVCDLPDDRALYTDRDGTPLVYVPEDYDHPAYYTHYRETFAPQAYIDLVNQWQADPDNDCLRARGSRRWIAACTFTSQKAREYA